MSEKSRRRNSKQEPNLPPTGFVPTFTPEDCKLFMGFYNEETPLSGSGSEESKRCHNTWKAECENEQQGLGDVTRFIDTIQAQQRNGHLTEVISYVDAYRHLETRLHRPGWNDESTQQKEERRHLRSVKAWLPKLKDQLEAETEATLQQLCEKAHERLHEVTMYLKEL